jgi:hypothetical protein
MQKKSNQCYRCRPQLVGPNNPNWKGGTFIHKRGYVMRKVTNDHHRSGSNNGYVMEHILVMEDFLGRSLLAHETVHHINGVRDDNRIENLELWTKPQPTGIRAVDALDWAREIIALYEPDESALREDTTADGLCPSNNEQT